MATDRDEQQRQQRELEEIRRSFAEMGARMGSLFEPTGLQEPEPAPRPERQAVVGCDHRELHHLLLENRNSERALEHLAHGFGGVGDRLESLPAS